MAVVGLSVNALNEYVYRRCSASAWELFDVAEADSVKRQYWTAETIVGSCVDKVRGDGAQSLRTHARRCKVRRS